VSFSDHVSSIVRPLNYFFSKTTELISTKFVRKHIWGMGIQVCENQGAGWHLLGAQKGVKFREFFKMIFS